MHGEQYETCQYIYVAGVRTGEHCATKITKPNEFNLCARHKATYLKSHCLHGNLKSYCDVCADNAGGGGSENIDIHKNDYCQYNYRNGAPCGVFLRVRNKFNLCSKHKVEYNKYHCEHELKKMDCPECRKVEKLRRVIKSTIEGVNAEDLEKIAGLLKDNFNLPALS